MHQIERDRTILAILTPFARARIEEVVDDIIDECLGHADPKTLHEAARSFDAHGKLMANDEKIIAMQLAAALRARACAPSVRH